MGKSMETTECKRKAVIELHKAKKSIRDISKQLQVPRSTVHDIVTKFKEFSTVKNLPRTGRPTILTPQDKRRIVRLALKNPRITTKDLCKELEDSNVCVSHSTVRRCLNKNSLKGRRPRKTPLHQSRHLKARLDYAKRNIDKDFVFWNSVLWTDETKIELFGHSRSQFVWRKPNDAYNPNFTVPKVKHGGGNLMFWGSFAARGPGHLVCIKETMTKDIYKKILEENLKKSATKLSLGRRFIFQQDNDPKHTAKIVKNWLENNRINVLEWPAQSPDLNPIENLWTYWKEKVHSRGPKNLQELEQFAIEEWSQIPMSLCRKMVVNYGKRLEKVIKAKGHAIDY